MSSEEVHPSDTYGGPDVQSISAILSDALMRANNMESCVVVYVTKDKGEVCTNFSATRINRLGMLVDVLFHEIARSVRDVDDYEAESE